jgi:hypothetical protein
MACQVRIWEPLILTKDHVLKDKLVETSSVTLAVLAKDVPVPIAFNAKLTLTPAESFPLP